MTDEAPRRRSALVTAAAWLLVAGSTPLLPVSFISFLMFLAGSEGTRSATLLGALAVVGGPPAALLVGLGLWRRWRWAWAGALPLLASVALWGVAETLRRPVPARTWVTPEGVLTHVAATGAAGPLPAVATVAALGVLALLLTPRVRREFFAPRAATATATGARRVAAPAQAASRPRVDDGSDESRDWRVGHVGRDEMYYEELRDGRWERIRIGGEMLMGRAHHVSETPDCRPPGTFGAADLAPPPRTQDATISPSQRRAGMAALLLLLTLAGSMAWLVGHGIASGATFLPIRHVDARRIVERAGEPATFWLSIGVYAAIGAGSIGLAAWGLRAALPRDD